MNKDAFLKELELKAGKINALLKAHAPAEEGSIDRELAAPWHGVLNALKVTEAMNYAVSSGGKRIRPLLCMETFELLGGENGDILKPFLLAIEYIHTYSLVHDDLPAMDNDEYRRGRKTTHAVYGEAFGILAGDGLLNLAYETALSACDFCTSEEEMYRVIDAVRTLATKAGIRGMVGGQSADIESEDKTDWKRFTDEGETVDEREATLLYINENKTAALIEAAILTGAILAGADRDAVQRLEIAASHIGNAFQIRDDILDAETDDENKLTYVSVYGMEEAVKTLGELSGDAIQILSEFGAKEDSFLISLISWMTERTI